MIKFKCNILILGYSSFCKLKRVYPASFRIDFQYYCVTQNHQISFIYTNCIGFPTSMKYNVSIMWKSLNNPWNLYLTMFLLFFSIEKNEYLKPFVGESKLRELLSRIETLKAVNLLLHVVVFAYLCHFVIWKSATHNYGVLWSF